MRLSIESIFRASIVTGIALAIAGCAAGSGQTSDEPIVVMTFNVQNLFDTEDDPGKNDQTYLPLAAKTGATHIAGCREIDNPRWRDECLNLDWSEATLARKLDAVAASILQVGDGRGPDILVLQEVENLAVLERLRKDYLAGAGYRAGVLLEGADRRGIDVAFLSRFPLAGGPRLHEIDFAGVESERIDDTRGILEATFDIGGGLRLTGYAVHFPAPYHPYQMRERAYEALNGLLDALPENRHAFAAGDFNTTAEEKRVRGMLERFVRDDWDIAHEFGCGDCPGTYYYRPDDRWSFLDMILWRRLDGPTPRLRLAPDSAALATGAPGQTTAAGTPARFRIDGGPGVSDHWPLLVTIERL